eukprot:TRINITY_DN27555_c0_g1_i1.p1 TRINITY_DN27555_c0_g1~~TRINITY_DN27555_c0_g1_i1.p1  ORF type:complete len:274 (+),score=49.51 TRINITY_DN27555_c0_g1_i1:85-906(+)
MANTVVVLDLSGDRVFGPETVDPASSVEDLKKSVGACLGQDAWNVGLYLVTEEEEDGQGREVAAAGVFEGDISLGARLGLSEASKQDISLHAVVVQMFDLQVIADIQRELVVDASPAMHLLPGIITEEFEAVEAKYGFRFPPDLKAFLRVGMPKGWHNWHALASDEIPLGFHGDTVSFVLDWHATPEEEEHREAARNHPLIPIVGHRMIPSIPCQAGLPVFSMHQCSDNIVDGENFWVWLERESKKTLSTIPADWKARSISCDKVPFWSDLID